MRMRRLPSAASPSRLFSRLSVQQMEELAAESQALVDKAFAMVRANGVTG
jgi:hypothetical protein